MKTFLENVFEKIGKLVQQTKPKKNKENELKSEIKPVTPPQKVEIDIPSKVIVKAIILVALFLALGRIFIQLRDIATITFVCLFLALGLSPLVSSIERHRIPRPLAILFIYVIFLGMLGLLFYTVVPILGDQLLSISQDVRTFFTESGAQGSWLHDILSQLQMDPNLAQKFISENLSQISQNLQSVAGSTFVIVGGIFQGVFNFIFALVVLFFLLMEREQVGRFILLLFPERDRAYLQEKTIRVQNKVAAWFRGQVILMVSVGVSMYVGMKFLEFFFGMQYAATIGMLAGFMELFPYIGVIITGILSGLVALNISWELFLAVMAWIALIQFLEGSLLVPLVMERVTGLPSVMVILALAIGGVLGSALGGVPMAILGMILSIPIAASIAIFVTEYEQKKR